MNLPFIHFKTVFNKMNVLTGTQSFRPLSLPDSVAIYNLRALAILLILACHILQSYGNGWCYVFNIGVQIFFLISGVLHGTKQMDNIKNWYKHKFTKIFIPYYVFLIIILPVYWIFWPEYISIKASIAYLLDIQGTGVVFVDGLGSLWFMTVIAICYIITPILQFFKSKSGIISICLLGVMIVNYTYFHKIENLCSAIGLYTFGFYIVDASTRIKTVAIVASLIFVTGIFVSPSVDYNQIFQGINSLNHVFHDFSSIFIVLFVMMCFNIAKVSKVNPMVRYISDYSFPIYLVHGLFCVGGPMSLFNKIGNVPLAVISFLAISMVCAILLDRISSFVGNRLIKTIH